MNISLDAGCFACASDGPRMGRVRMLCIEHKAACRLADGAMLRAVLANASPLDSPLEGNLLAWLYNPVHVEDRRGVLRCGWTDFAGGGMGVLEDVFGAERFFDMWTALREEGVALLRDLAGASPTEVQPRLGSSQYAHRQFAALAHSMWRRGMAIQERLKALGRWPESFAELQGVIDRESDESTTNDVAEDAAFASYLSALAHRWAVGAV